MKEQAKNLLLNNWLAKLMALVIALFLWATIMGRRDFVLTKVMTVEFATHKSQVIQSQTADRVRVRVSGPRSSLMRFIDDPDTQKLRINISNSGYGNLELEVPSQQIQTPPGVKILSVRPNLIRVEVTNASE